MRHFSRRHATQEQIDAHRDKIRAELAGQGFKIDSNGYGLRIECNACHESNTLNPEQWARNHGHESQGIRRQADFREVTVNADGSRDMVLYYL